MHIAETDTSFAEFPFRIRFDLTRVLDALPGLMNDTLRIDLEGRYSFPGPLGRLKQKFRYREEIPLRRELEGVVKPFEGLFDGGN